MIVLVGHSPFFDNMVWDYRRSFAGEDIPGAFGLAQAQCFEDWNYNRILHIGEAMLPAGHVPSTNLVAMRTEDGKMVGVVDIRHRLTDSLLDYGGHIGYSVRPDERRKGYAKEILSQALDYCRRELQLDRALITCDKANEGSRRAILANGGVLEDERNVVEGQLTQRYWITL